MQVGEGEWADDAFKLITMSIFQIVNPHDERGTFLTTKFKKPNLCLQAAFHKYPQVIFGNGGGAPPGPSCCWTQVGRVAWDGGEERKGEIEQQQERSA